MSEGNVAADQLRLFIERIERLEEEKRASLMTSAMFIARRKAKDMTLKSCVRSCVFVKWKPMTVRKWKRS